MSDKDRLIEFVFQSHGIKFKISDNAFEIIEIDGTRSIEFLFNPQGKLITHVFHGSSD